jgi:cyanophycin synthetase
MRQSVGRAAGLADKVVRRSRSWLDLARVGGVAPVTAHLLSHAEEVLRVARDQAYEQLWGSAATELGATMRPLGRGFLEIRRDGAVTRVRGSTVMLDDVVTFVLDKEIGQALLAERGVPVPDHVTLHDADPGQVERFLDATPEGCVVKPAEGYSGRGVTCGVRTRRDFALAVRRAAGYSARVLVERMVPGASYRVLLLDGELLDVIRRDPPHVQGDGRSTIAELIAAENRRRVAARGEEGLSRLAIDLDCVFTLRAAGRTLRSVPAAGERVRVKTAVAGNAARENHTVREDVSPELVRECVGAAEAVAVRVAGVDVLTSDVSRPLAETGGAINEVNTTPSLLHHTLVADRAVAPRVAVPILCRLLANAEQGPFVR